MDPLDPLTELVRTGQGFSSFIFFERLIWLLIGLFFMGAMSTSIQNGMKGKDRIGSAPYMFGIKKQKQDNISKETDKKKKNKS